jgi:ubiquinone/menaquinone biosynthesis C-methylase UbiE
MSNFSDPQHNVDQLELRKGQKVADFGVGSGFYTFAAALRVGENGLVYALDIQKDLLTRLKEDATRKGLDNIEIVWSDLEAPSGSKLGDSSVDSVIVSNILFQVENKEIFVKEVARVLKPGGSVLLVDWSDSYGGLGPSKEHLISKDEAVSLFVSRGFSVLREISAGPHHYGIVLKK